MSTLTKIAIVVLLVLILITSVVFISHASTTANYRYAYEQQLARNKDLSQHTQYVTDMMNNYRRQKTELAEQLEQARNQMGTDISDLQTQLADAKQENAHLKSDLEDIKLKLANLSQTAELNVKRRQLLSDQLEKTRTKLAELQQEARNTEDLLKESRTRVERLEKQVRFMKERNAELNEQNADLRDQLAARGVEEAGEEKPAPMPPAQISGTITAIKGNTASINVGSAKGVKDKMELIIYRGGNLVGYLRIEEVDTTSAAGIVFNKQLDPMQGDKVTTSLE